MWDLAPGFSGGFNSRFSREIGLECMSCHNTYPAFVQGSTNKFTQVPNGIACERCHGAGEVHVRAIQLGHIVDTTKTIDYTIVNPAKLPVELQIDVCQRCHLQGNAVLKPGKSFFDFKPGMHLSDIEDVFMPKYEGMEDEYIMASHIARLKMSKCFINSQFTIHNSQLLKPYKNSLTCVTCHNPHIDVRSVGSSFFNAICQNCHGKKNSNLCTETQEKREVVNDDCIKCHMSKGNTIDIPHVITTDHYIRIPSKQKENEVLNNKKSNPIKESKETQKIKKFITLYDVNNPNPSSYTRGRAFIQQYASFEDDLPLLLDSAAHYFPQTNYSDIRMNFSSLVEISFYKKDYSKIIYYAGMIKPKVILDSVLVHKDYSNNDAWTAYRVGEAYYAFGNMQGACAFYSKAIELAPFIPEFLNKLAVTQVALHQLTEADKTITIAISQDSTYVSALTNKGYIELLKGNTGLSKQYYDKALTANPDDKQALLNTAGWYIYEKQNANAKEYLKMILKKYPEDSLARSLLAKLNSTY
jgi:tetratricopeptide (TPR) repeat protein